MSLAPQYVLSNFRPYIRTWMSNNLTQVVLQLLYEVNQTRQELKELETALNQTSNDVDRFFVVQMTIIVFGTEFPSGSDSLAMQLGFAFLEAGNLRVKHVTNMLMKVVMDSLLASLGWWAVGFAFAFGDRPGHVTDSLLGLTVKGNGFIGTTYFFSTELPAHEASKIELWWFFYWTFCAAASIIVSGTTFSCAS